MTISFDRPTVTRQSREQTGLPYSTIRDEGTITLDGGKVLYFTAIRFFDPRALAGRKVEWEVELKGRHGRSMRTLAGHTYPDERADVLSAFRARIEADNRAGEAKGSPVKRLHAAKLTDVTEDELEGLSVVRTHCGNDPVTMDLNCPRLQTIFACSVKQDWLGGYLTSELHCLTALLDGKTIETQGWEWTLARKAPVTQDEVEGLKYHHGGLTDCKDPVAPLGLGALARIAQIMSISDREALELLQTGMELTTESGTFRLVPTEPEGGHEVHEDLGDFVEVDPMVGDEEMDGRSIIVICKGTGVIGVQDLKPFHLNSVMLAYELQNQREAFDLLKTGRALNVLSSVTWELVPECAEREAERPVQLDPDTTVGRMANAELAEHQVIEQQAYCEAVELWVTRENVAPWGANGTQLQALPLTAPLLQSIARRSMGNLSTQEVLARLKAGRLVNTYLFAFRPTLAPAAAKEA